MDKKIRPREHVSPMDSKSELQSNPLTTNNIVLEIVHRSLVLSKEKHKSGIKLRISKIRGNFFIEIGSSTLSKTYQLIDK